MGPSSKLTKSIRLNEAKAKKLTGYLDEIEAHYRPIIEAWPSLTSEQRQAVLVHSPILSRLVALVRPVLEGESWRT